MPRSGSSPCVAADIGSNASGTRPTGPAGRPRTPRASCSPIRAATHWWRLPRCARAAPALWSRTPVSTSPGWWWTPSKSSRAGERSTSSRRSGSSSSTATAAPCARWSGGCVTPGPSTPTGGPRSSAHSMRRSAAMAPRRTTASPRPCAGTTGRSWITIPPPGSGPIRRSCTTTAARSGGCASCCGPAGRWSTGRGPMVCGRRFGPPAGSSRRCATSMWCSPICTARRRRSRTWSGRAPRTSSSGCAGGATARMRTWSRRSPSRGT